MGQMFYYTDGDGQEVGPVSATELKVAVADGRLTLAGQVRKAGSASWHPAGEVRGLFATGMTQATAEDGKAVGHDRRWKVWWLLGRMLLLVLWYAGGFLACLLVLGSSSGDGVPARWSPWWLVFSLFAYVLVSALLVVHGTEALLAWLNPAGRTVVAEWVNLSFLEEGSKMGSGDFLFRLVFAGMDPSRFLLGIKVFRHSLLVGFHFACYVVSCKMLFDLYGSQFWVVPEGAGASEWAWYGIDSVLKVVLLDIPDTYGWRLSGIEHAKSFLPSTLVLSFNFAVAAGVMRLLLMPETSAGPVDSTNH